MIQWMWRIWNSPEVYKAINQQLDEVENYLRLEFAEDVNLDHFDAFIQKLDLAEDLVSEVNSPDATKITNRIMQIRKDYLYYGGSTEMQEVD